VTDLAEAHVRSLDHLMGGGDCLTLNCGYGRGYSVREVIEGIKRICGTPLNVNLAPRRPGDVATLVADPGRLLAAFDWTPRHDDLDTILRTALDWERR
jgi:UDP-glucose 4-epimerase